MATYYIKAIREGCVMVEADSDQEALALAGTEPENFEWEDEVVETEIEMVENNS